MSTYSLVFQIVTMFLVLNKQRKIKILKIFREVLKRDRVFRKQERAAARRKKREQRDKTKDEVKLKHF